MAEEAAIRVWLEPGYDGGRVGAWMLDLPGCFCWGRTRSSAVARAPAAVARFVVWLGDQGESVEMPELDDTAIAEEVPATVVKGYERNALFTADRRPITARELETTDRRLGYARTDLLKLVEGSGSLDADGPANDGSGSDRPERSGAEVIRHIAATEAWLGGRLDPTARFDGGSRERDPKTFLADSRSWLVDRLRQQFTRDPALSRTDDQGEKWTLAKVLRRALYHSLDHLEELDRRLAWIDGRLDRVAIRRDARVDPADLAELLRTAGLNRGRRSPQQVARMLASTRETVSAWDGPRLIGFARAISDGITNAYVSSVAVDPRWQDRGLGGRLIETLVDGRDGIKFVLTAREGTEGFYRRLGFEPDPRILVRQRRRPSV